MGLIMVKNKKYVSTLWVLLSFTLVFLLIINLGVFIINTENLRQERIRTDVLNNDIKNTKLILSSEEKLLENSENFTDNILEKSIHSSKLISIAKTYWSYGLYVNGIQVTKSEVTVSGSSFTIELREFSQNRKLTWTLHNKGAVTGGDLKDDFSNHLIFLDRTKKYTSDTTDIDAISRTYKSTYTDLKSGDSVQFQITAPLNEWLKLPKDGSNINLTVKVR